MHTVPAAWSSTAVVSAANAAAMRTTAASSCGGSLVSIDHNVMHSKLVERCGPAGARQGFVGTQRRQRAFEAVLVDSGFVGIIAGRFVLVTRDGPQLFRQSKQVRQAYPQCPS